MSVDTQLAKVSSPAHRGWGAGVDARAMAQGTGTVLAHAPATPNIAKIVHQGLRGRYAICIVLGVVCGAAAALATLRLVHPMYRSEGLVKIAYSLPEVMHETDQNRPLPNFDMIMQSQRALITSQRLIEMVSTDPIWKSRGVQVPPDPAHYFATYMKVDVSPRSDMIVVSVSDPDPGTAGTAVTAVINSYQTLYNDQQSALERPRRGVLDDKLNGLKSTIETLNDQIKQGEKDYGSSDLSVFYDSKAAQVTNLEKSLNEVRMALATLPASAISPTPAPATTSEPQAHPADVAAPLTAEEIAATDPVMQRYWAEQTQLEERLQQLQIQGYKEGFKDVVSTKAALERSHKKIDDYAVKYRQFHVATAQGLGDPKMGPVLTAGKSADVLRANLASLTELYATTKKEMVDLGAKQNALRRLREQLKDARDEQDLLSKRLAELQDEGSLGGRLTVISTGETPLAPERNKRPYVAVAAGGAGTCVPAGFLLLLSFLNGKYRYSDDAEGAGMPHKTPLLGILPEVGAGNEPEEMAAAAHSVHQLRVGLTAKRQGRSPAVYLITSALSGEGKTSVAMSLGLSCVASRIRTLIIDGDLVGRKLTATLQARDMEGLHEAVATGTLRQRVRRTDSGLFVLPAGGSSANDACSLSAPMVKSLLDEARRYFDVVIIDSGPILGSVEASVFAQEADEVIFTISRGQSKQVVDRGMNRLKALGANMAGCVFNRAKPEDFDTSPYGSSSRSATEDAPRAAMVANRMDRYTRFGSLVQAVAAGTPMGQN